MYKNLTKEKLTKIVECIFLKKTFNDWLSENATRVSLTTWKYKGNIVGLKCLRKHYYNSLNKNARS